MMPDAPRKHEAGVEGLRGFAALCVLYTHFLWQTDLDPAYQAADGWKIFEASQGAVLLFFILSGYVIGLTNDRPFSAANAIGYARRRGIRLFPIYWLAVLLSVAVRPVDSWGVVLGNALFLQNDIPLGVWNIPAMRANSNLWTLNYEVLYYSLFLFVWASPRSWTICAGVALGLGVVTWLLPGNWGPLLSCYAMGWLYWLVGYGISRSPSVQTAAAVPLPSLSLLLFWFVTWQEKPFWAFAHRFGLLPVSDEGWINYSFVDFIPACVVLMLAASGRRPRFTRMLCWITAAIPLGFQAWQAIRGRLDLWPMGHDTAFCLIACALWWWRPDGERMWARLAWVGSISYGTYIFQRPVQWYLHDATWLPQGSLPTLLLRCALAFALTFAIAWLAERQLQPVIRRRLSGGAGRATRP